MKTNSAGRKLIEEFEGFVDHAYRDVLGHDVFGHPVYDVWTIGYGHTDAAGLPKVYDGMVVTQAQADQILSADLAGVEADVERLVKVTLNDNQFSALVSFTYNLGAGNLLNSTLLRRLNAGDYDIGNEFGKWTRAQNIVLGGLVRRRAAERALWEAPVGLVQPAPEIAPTASPEAPVGIPEAPAQGAFLLLLKALGSIFLTLFGNKK